MSPSPSNEGSQEDTENNQVGSHKNFKPLQLFHPHGIEGNDEASVQSALSHTSTPVPARSISQSLQTTSSGGINLQNYSRSTIAATHMFSPHDAMNAGSLIDPSPLITRRLDDRNRRRSDGAGDVDAHDDNHPVHNGDLGNTNQRNDDGESLLTPSSSEIDQVGLLGEEARGAEASLDNLNNNTSENNNNDDTGEGHNNNHNSWEHTFQTVRHPISSTKAYFTNLSSIFTWGFLSYLGVVNFCILGGAFTLVMALGLPLFKELGIDASRQQLYMTMIMSPWAMKPFIGVASDLFPIRGYNKRYFALYSILIGLIGCTFLLILYQPNTASNAISAGPTAVQHLADLLVICFTCISYEGATLDILGEGKYSEYMRLRPDSGSGIISYKFGMSLAGSIITQMYVGPLSDMGYFHTLFWIASGLALAPFFPTLMGWIPEKKRSSQEPGMTKLCPGFLFDRGMFLRKRTPFIVITLSGLAGPLMAAVTTFADLEIGLIFSGLLLIVLAVITYFVFPKVVCCVILAMMLMNVSSPQLGSALGYFYTADEQCLADGPHFNYTYYITITGIVGSVVNFVSVILYQAFMSTWRFRPALIFTIVIGSLAPMVDLVIVMRWNEAIGISDEVFFLLGNAIFENLVVILLAIPMSAIYAKVSPPGMESAVFAYVVGIGNFTGMFSGLLGSAIIEWSKMKTVGEDCDFSELPTIIVLFKILLPMLVGIPATFLIPNVLQTEPLIDWDKEKWCEEDVSTGNDGEHGESLMDPQISVGNEEDDGRIEPHLL